MPNSSCLFFFIFFFAGEAEYEVLAQSHTRQIYSSADSDVQYFAA